MKQQMLSLTFLGTIHAAKLDLTSKVLASSIG